MKILNNNTETIPLGWIDNKVRYEGTDVQTFVDN